MQPSIQTIHMRRNMVESQLRPNKVLDVRLLDVFSTTPRETFVPDALRGVAYSDDDLPLGHGRALMAPMVLARLLDAAAITDADNVLEIGTGSGYGTAILAQMARHVVSLDGDNPFAELAKSGLARLGLDNVTLRQGDVSVGEADFAPYSRIIAMGSVKDVPTAWLEQLADGGKLLAVKLGKDGIGRAMLYEKIGSNIGNRVLFDAAIAPLAGLKNASLFVF